MNIRNKFHYLFLVMLLVCLSSCDTTQVDEEESGFSDDSLSTGFSDSTDSSSESSVSFGGTFVESYSEQGVLCGDELVDFPDHSFVAKFVMGNDVFTMANLKKYMFFAVPGRSPEISGLDADLILRNSKKLHLPFSIPEGQPEENINVYIDWGDGNCEKHSSGSSFTHEYEMKGTYQVKVIGNAHSLGGSSTELTKGAEPVIDIRRLIYRLNLYEVVELGDLSWKYLYGAFARSYGLRKFQAKNTDTSQVKTMVSMFNRTFLKELDVSNFNFNSLETLTLDTIETKPLESFIHWGWFFQKIILPDFEGSNNDSLNDYGNVFNYEALFTRSSLLWRCR